MRKLGIGCVIAASLIIFGISAALWVWSATSSWSNNEGTGIFLTAIFPVTPIILMGWVLSAIGSWLIRRGPPAVPSTQTRLMSWGRILSILALFVVGLGVGLPVLAAALGGGLQLSTIIESVAALSAALALLALTRLCQRLS